MQEKLSFNESAEGDPIKEVVLLKNEVTALEKEVIMLQTNTRSLQEKLTTIQKINNSLSKQLEREVIKSKAKTLSLLEELGTTQKKNASLSRELEYTKAQLLSTSKKDDDVPMKIQDVYVSLVYITSLFCIHVVFCVQEQCKFMFTCISTCTLSISYTNKIMLSCQGTVPLICNLYNIFHMLEFAVWIFNN